MKIAFLDLDGTLVDSSLRHVETLKQLLNDCNIKYSNIADYITYKAEGNTTKEYLIDRLNLDEKIAGKISEGWVNHIEDDLVMILDRWYEDASIFVHFLKVEGYKIYVLTARRNVGFTESFIRNSEIWEYIDEIVTVNPKNASKEKADFIHSLMDKNESYNILVGDTEADYEAAKEAGIRIYVLNRGFRSKKFWDEKQVESYCSLIKIKERLVDEEKLTR